MKPTVALALAVAALTGALVATAADGDDDRPVQAALPTQPAPVAGASAGDPVETAAEVTDPDDRPIGRRELRRVRDAALGAAGGGRVVDIDRSDDAGVAYEIEIHRRGRDVDVHLDRDLRPVATDYDD